MAKKKIDLKSLEVKSFATSAKSATKGGIDSYFCAQLTIIYTDCRGRGYCEILSFP